MKIRGNRLLRRLDESFGRALIFVLRIFKKQRAFPKVIQSIGVLKLTAIGDLVLLSGVLQDIRRQHPNARIVLFCGEDNHCLSPVLPAVDQIIALSVKNLFRSVWQLRKTTLSLFIDFGQWSRIEALFSFLSKSQYRVGFKTEGQQRHVLYDAICPHSAKVHEIDNYRALARQAKIDSVSLPSLFLKKEPSKWDSLCKERMVIFHPWASGFLNYLKEWSLSSWIELGQLLLASGYQILLSGGSKDFEPNQKIVLALQSNSRIHNLAGRLSLNELGHFIKDAHCVISVNTGIMHFAACFTGRLIALQGPASVLRWGPLHPEASSICSEDPQSGYLYLGFEYPKNASRCMEKISVEKVWAKFIAMGALHGPNC